MLGLLLVVQCIMYVLSGKSGHLLPPLTRHVYIIYCILLLRTTDELRIKKESEKNVACLFQMYLISDSEVWYHLFMPGHTQIYSHITHRYISHNHVSRILIFVHKCFKYVYLMHKLKKC